MKVFFLVGFFFLALVPGAVYGIVNDRCGVPSVDGGESPGVCLPTAACTSSGGKYYSGYCNDIADVKCCTKPSCSNGGSCKWTNQCNGNTVAGQCPGPAQFKCCIPTGPPQQTTCTGQILLRAFIPTELVRVEIPREVVLPILLPQIGGMTVDIHNGNNRGFCHDCGDSKADLAAFFKFDPAKRTLDFSSVGNGDGGFGPTRAYWVWDTNGPRSGEPSWAAHPKNGVQPRDHTQLMRTSSNLFVQVKEKSSNHGLLLFVVAAANPLLKGAPELNVNISVALDLSVSGNLHFHFNGEHDDFPNYEIYVGQHRVFSWDAVENGKSPFDLVYKAKFDATFDISLDELATKDSCT